MISSCNYDTPGDDTSFDDGYQSLLKFWKKSLDDEDIEIETSTAVTKINWKNDNGKVVVETKDRRSFEADHVIVTVSLGKFYFKMNIITNLLSPNFKVTIPKSSL